MSAPGWVADAVFYAIVPDRFGRRAQAGSVPWNQSALEPWDAAPRARAYKGGNLGGITEQIGHLVSLGVTAIYLTPIFRSQSYHRYKPLSHFEVDPLLGGNEAFDELLAAAHRSGLRVVLDGVFNHVSWGFPQFLDVLENGPNSPWKDWFLIDGWPLNADHESDLPANYRCWNGRKSMPELNHQHPAVRQYVLDAAEHWVRKGIDGWRFDCPVEVGDHAFWRHMRTRLRRINADVYLLGEVWADATAWLDGSQWDGVTNYPLMFAVHRFIGGDRIDESHIMPGRQKESALDARGFVQALERLHARQSWDTTLAQLNFLNSADTPRWRTLIDEDAASVRLAALLLFTLPGVPCILYGDEVGLPGGPDPDCRRGFPAAGSWDYHCLDDYQSLCALRRANPALRRGAYRTIQADGGLLVFERSTREGRLMVALNTGQSAACVALHECELQRGERLFGHGQLEHGLRLPARAGAVFRPAA